MQRNEYNENKSIAIVGAMAIVSVTSIVVPALANQPVRILEKKYEKNCPCGASSFVTEGTRLGIKVVGYDPLIGSSKERLV